MTTFAMIFGMLPLFFGLGEGAEFRAPMARAVVGGLITSTLLTLIVVPVVYAMLDDVTVWLFRKRKAAPAAAHVLMMCASAGRPDGRGRAAYGDGVVRRPIGRDAGARAGTRVAQVQMLTLADALQIAAGQNRDIQKALEYGTGCRASTGRNVRPRSRKPRSTRVWSAPTTTVRTVCSVTARVVGRVGARRRRPASAISSAGVRTCAGPARR